MSDDIRDHRAIHILEKHVKPAIPFIDGVTIDHKLTFEHLEQAAFILDSLLLSCAIRCNFHHEYCLVMLPLDFINCAIAVSINLFSDPIDNRWILFLYFVCFQI